jgi:hypothetical protein
VLVLLLGALVKVTDFKSMLSKRRTLCSKVLAQASMKVILRIKKKNLLTPLEPD